MLDRMALLAFLFTTATVELTVAAVGGWWLFGERSGEDQFFVELASGCPFAPFQPFRERLDVFHQFWDLVLNFLLVIFTLFDLVLL